MYNPLKSSIFYGDITDRVARGANPMAYTSDNLTICS